jgi:hypothetical protein
MSFITYPQENNKLAVIIPTGDVNSVIKDVPEGVEYKIVSSLDIDNDYFDAYEFDKAVGAKINISKAKEAHFEKFRATRTPLLAALDVDFMRAVESGNLELKKEIAAKKQALRNVTKVDLPNTLEEIKATWPEILGKNPFSS